MNWIKRPLLLGRFFLSLISVLMFRLVYNRLLNKNASNVILLLAISKNQLLLLAVGSELEF